MIFITATKVGNNGFSNYINKILVKKERSKKLINQGSDKKLVMEG